MIQPTLYIVSTPIGNLEDISFRAVNILKSVDLILAEDTRHSRKLLDHYNIHTPMSSYHAHTAEHKTRHLIALLEQGQSLALISDAGTPLISDPGLLLVQAARQAKLAVVPIPGPSAAVAALSAAGLPADKFYFAGFLGTKSAQRLAQLEQLLNATHTTVFYEAPHRIQACVKQVAELAPERQICLAKEITKKFEVFFVGSSLEAVRWLSEGAHARGEFVVIVSGGPAKTHSKDYQKVLFPLLDVLALKQAVQLCRQITGESKNDIYQAAVAYLAAKNQS